MAGKSTTRTTAGPCGGPQLASAPRAKPGKLAWRCWPNKAERRRWAPDAYSSLTRAEAFRQRFGFGVPVPLAPMAGACPVSWSAAVANAGGLGACCALFMRLAAILERAARLRSLSNGPFQLNLGSPTRRPQRDPTGDAGALPFAVLLQPAYSGETLVGFRGGGDWLLLSSWVVRRGPGCWAAGLWCASRCRSS